MSEFVGCDCCKSRYDIWVGKELMKVPREPEAVEAFVLLLKKRKVAGVVMEPTGKYHLMLAQAAHSHGIPVYLVNPAAFASYRQSRSYRADNDEIAARLLARYGEKEHDELRVWAPPEPVMVRVRSLLGVRAAAMKSRILLESSLSESHLEPSPATIALFKAVEDLKAQEKALEKEICALLAQNPTYLRLRKVPGLGVLSAACLTWALSRGEFSSRDKFVAFLGLDVRVRQSGKYVGIRKLTKRGDALIRKILFSAATSLCRTTAWKGRFAELMARGLKFTAAAVVVMRQLARLAWTLNDKQMDFQPNYRKNLDMKP
jgi:transposase